MQRARGRAKSSGVLEALHFEAITDTGLIREVARFGGFALELLPELPDEHTQVVRLLDVRRSPDLLEKLAVGDDPAGVLDERDQEPVLGRRQVNLLVADE